MSRSIQYGELPTAELEFHARVEAHAFQFPSDWRDGRLLRHAVAIDEDFTLDRDDALDASEGDNETDLLHVSIVDPGAFSSDLVAVKALAQRRLATKYRRDTAELPMIPRELSEDKWSFMHDQDRPGITLHLPVSQKGEVGALTFDREVVRAASLSPREVNLIPAGLDTPINRLERIARALYHNRRGEEGFALEDEEGRLASGEYNRAKFIVKQCMIAANIAIGQYFTEYEIPGLRRRHDVPIRTQLLLGGAELSEALALEFARADYSEVPGSRHLGLKAKDVLHFTSPLRRFYDFADHCNLAAHIDGDEFPFPQKVLAYIASRHSRLNSVRNEPSTKRFEMLDVMRQKLQTDETSIADLAHIFFGTLSGTKEDALALRQDVLVQLLDKKGVARSVIEIALQKKWVHVETDEGQTWLVDEHGERIPYSLPRTTAAINLRTISESIMTLSHRAHAPMEQRDIAERITRAATLKDGREFMRELSFRLRTPVQESVTEHEDGSSSVTITMRLGGELKSSTVVADNPQEAKLLAIGAFITENDLLNNPPSLSPLVAARIEAQKIRTAAQADQRSHPVVLIKRFADKQQLHVSYKNKSDTDDEGSPRNTTVLHLIDGEGTIVYQAAAAASRGEDAKLLAAAKLANERELKAPKRAKK